MTGKATNFGGIDNIAGWDGQAVLDRANNRLYMLAGSSSATNRLYGFDLTTGSISSNALPWNGYIGGVTTNGQIVAMSNDGAGWVLSLIDPGTATASKLGLFGDLTGAQFLVFDSTRGVASTVGTSAQGPMTLYSFELSSGVVTQVTSKQRHLFAKQ